MLQVKSQIRYKSFLFLYILLLVVPGSGCKRAVKVGGKSATKSTKGLSKVAVGAMVAAGAYIVTEESLKNTFRVAPISTPIETKLHNQTSTNLDFSVTLDGTKWSKVSISPHDHMTVGSAEKGLVGLKVGTQFLKIDKSNTYIFERIEGDVNIYSHGSY